MTMRRRTSGAVALAALLAVGGSAAAWAAGDPAPVTAPAAAEAAAAEAADEARVTVPDEVLADLVEQGTLTQEQADEVLAALRTGFEERREARQAFRTQALELMAEARGMTVDELREAWRDRSLEPLTDEQRDALRQQMLDLREELGLPAPTDEQLERWQERAERWRDGRGGGMGPGMGRGAGGMSAGLGAGGLGAGGMGANA